MGKRINYLLGDQADCAKGIDKFADDEELPQTTTEAAETPENDLESNEDKCKEEAIRLALEYNFVTDVTSMVVEEEDEYVKKGTVGVNKEIVHENDDEDDYYDSYSYSYSGRSSGIVHRSGGTGHSSGHSTGLVLKSSSGIVPVSSNSYHGSRVVAKSGGISSY